MKKILFIIGSLRKKSFNRQLANEVEKIITPKAEIKYLEYEDLPYMNQDIEFPIPEAVARVRKEIQDSDAIWIFTPEYNYNIPGVLKNLFDWMSRPLIANDWNSGTAIKDKFVTISGVGGKNCTQNVREHLYNLLNAMQTKVIDEKGTGLAVSGEAFATDEANFSEADIEKIKKQAESFLSNI